MRGRRIGRVALVVWGALLVGCSSIESPVENNHEALPQAQTLSDEQDVGPAGGTLSCGPYTLVVPPAALTTTLHLTMKQVTAGQWPVDLGPHGTQFSQPVSLMFDAGGEPDPDAMSVYWWNPSTSTWVVQPTTHAGSSCVTTTTHFSRWKLQ